MCRALHVPFDVVKQGKRSGSQLCEVVCMKSKSGAAFKHQQLNFMVVFSHNMLVKAVLFDVVPNIKTTCCHSYFHCNWLVYPLTGVPFRAGS